MCAAVLPAATLERAGEARSRCYLRACGRVRGMRQRRYPSFACAGGSKISEPPPACGCLRAADWAPCAADSAGGLKCRVQRAPLAALRRQRQEGGEARHPRTGSIHRLPRALRAPSVQRRAACSSWHAGDLGLLVLLGSAGAAVAPTGPKSVCPLIKRDDKGQARL
ncbi:hypothetical protein FA09DRAFT_147693 [Tilletiopsis washingtonensis]|uniref:Uncharacterized protein n=1 Tax=Tilletiopsis washingtonensis TaxID=58919 RepID=A0A316Z2Z0_9BASI|nr:hypothetical protein FA09DRAFT_147693 [Tilletiopsis washingtonensis]PWN95328.1 hypothetical protein FA09DRAFT_147693 [Tilletiopsis washingtonensis]